MAESYSFADFLDGVSKTTDDYIEMYKPSQKPFELAPLGENPSLADFLQRVADQTQPLIDEITKSPFTTLPRSAFARDRQHGKELLMLNESLMREHEDRALIPARKTHFPEEGRRFDIAHLDKIRTARRQFYMFLKGGLSFEDINTLIKPFLNGSNAQGLQTEEMRQATEIQRATCDYLYVVMYRLYYLQGKDVWENSTLRQRRILYRQIRDQMPLVVDRLMYPTESKAVDFCGIHANTKSPLAKKYRQFCEYKFMRLCEATMYYRIWKFDNLKEPVYELYKKIGMEPTIKYEIGLPLDIMEIPGNHGGPRAINGRKRPASHHYGSFSLSEFKKKA
ncbi:hypothetical protein CBER1_03098 [Cercospora berteroae]|uniref:Uncharacterized protein n=1 Tax=Cercospora berteroae TaxID=357750 RepID=A0A2S6CK82_9PEZI|nr:hypothetical protein CBER1_03098 [Cercospora berteroae]